MRYPAVILLLAVVSCARPTAGEPGLRLHYDRPATYFEEALPIGNGRIGAMVYGGVKEERYSLNDITLWTGEGESVPKDYYPFGHLETHDAVEAVREALWEEDYERADTLQLQLQGHHSEAYQPLGRLRILHRNHRRPSGYSRWLDLEDATAGVRYDYAGGSFRSSCFVSSPDSVLVIRLEDSSGLDAEIRLDSPLPFRRETGDGSIDLRGYAAYHYYPDYADWKSYGDRRYYYDPARGIHFRTALRVLPEDGKVEATDSSLLLSGCKAAVILLANTTSFNGPFRNPATEGADYETAAGRIIEKAADLSYNALLEAHKADYSALFSRVSLDLGPTDERIRALPTDVQLRRYTDRKEHNPELEALYFQYGRYLLIASSRTPGVPANLQGLWNEQTDPPWSCNYTTNINLEENYWPAGPGNLPEMEDPLLEFLKALQVNGERAARDIYGVTPGWNLGQNSDIWATAEPVGLGTGDPSWANWTMGGAWLSTHIWEHYLFTRDREQLAGLYPVLRGAADFCLGWLVEKDGELITAPGTSPENLYKTPQGYIGSTLYGATADLAIIRECLQDAIAAARELGVDEDFIDRAQDALGHLRGYHIGKEGQLLEWYHDWEDYSPKHRHQSHLFGVFPGHQIVEGHLADAALKTLEIKGFETTGWSCGWRVNLYARLGDGENAYRMLRRLLRYVSPDRYKGPGARRGGGTYPNLMDAHSPFQIDGNFGGCAGIMEMLLRSAPDGTVTPLPALPAAWPSGHVSGLRTRGGETVEFSWTNGQITSQPSWQTKP